MTKVAILAGGMGVRFSEETDRKPKPLIEIGGMPIIWHIMSMYAHHGFDQFAVALGYKGDVMRRWFADHATLSPNLRVDLGSGSVSTIGDTSRVDWNVDLIETGQETNTGGRIKRLAPYLGDETFMLTWGDGVSDIDLAELLDFHKSHGKLATLTAVRPPARFGHLDLDGERVARFSEKPQTREGWINGAFFVLEPDVFNYIEGDRTGFELAPLETLATDGQLMAYRHDGFWQCMDTIRDKKRLQHLWDTEPPWRVWDSDPS